MSSYIRKTLIYCIILMVSITFFHTYSDESFPNINDILQTDNYFIDTEFNDEHPHKMIDFVKKLRETTSKYETNDFFDNLPEDILIFIQTLNKLDKGEVFIVNKNFIDRNGGKVTFEQMVEAKYSSPANSDFAKFDGDEVIYDFAPNKLEVGEYFVILVDSKHNILAKAKSPIYINDSTNPPDFRLSSIEVLGKKIDSFNPEEHFYVVRFSSMAIDEYANDFLSIVSASTKDPNGSVIIEYTEDPSIIMIRSVVEQMKSPFPYMVKFIETQDLEISDTTLNNLETINILLSELSNEDLSEYELTQKVESITNNLNSTIHEVKSSQEAETIYETISNSINKLSEVLPRLEQKNNITNEIADLTNNSRKLITFIDDSDKVTSLTISYIESINTFINQTDSKEYETKNLKNQLMNLSQQSVKRTGTIQFNDIKTSSSNAVIEFEQSKIAQDSEQAFKNFNLINDTLSKNPNTHGPRNIEPSITLSVNSKEDLTSVEAILDKESINLLSSKGFEKIGIQLENLEINFPNEILSESEEQISLKTVFAPAKINVPKETHILENVGVADITLYSNFENKKTFEKPIDLQFDLSEANLENLSESQLNNLSIFVQNPESLEWITVGGNYDPITKTIKTKRSSLSKYTVMQSQKTFSDVEYSWAKDEINELLGKGIIEETELFNPTNSVTREEFTLWIIKSYGLSKSEVNIPFEDIPKSHPYYSEISTAYNEGIINGKSSTTFDPQGYITREEMSVIVSNALSKFDNQSISSIETSTYQDSYEISSWAKNTVSLVDELGIMRGDGINFKPKNNITKEEAAAIIKRIYN